MKINKIIELTILIGIIISLLIVPQIQSSFYKLNNINDSEINLHVNNTKNDWSDYLLRFLPIHISGNDDLSGDAGMNNGVISGQGTVENPYVISGWRIDCFKWLWDLFNQFQEEVIYLKNVNKHVIIENDGFDSMTPF